MVNKCLYIYMKSSSIRKKPTLKTVTFNPKPTISVFQKPQVQDLRAMHGQSTITGKIAQEQEEHDRTVYAQTGMVTGDPPDGPIVQAELEALTLDTGPNKHWWGGKKTKTKKKSNRKSKKSNRKSKKSNRKSKKSNRKSKRNRRR
jgi:hypothetical protein